MSCNVPYTSGNYETGKLGEERIQYALQQIEGAQYLLSAARANLSSVIGLVREWDAIGKLHDRVQTMWHRLNKLRSEGPQ